MRKGMDFVIIFECIEKNFVIIDFRFFDNFIVRVLDKESKKKVFFFLFYVLKEFYLFGFLFLDFCV